MAKRLFLFLGLAYLLLAALASGLAYTGYVTQADGQAREPGHEPGPEPGSEPGSEPGPDGWLPPVCPARPPEPEANAPGLHTRPDGSRYLVMPLPKDVAGRLRPGLTVTIGGTA